MFSRLNNPFRRDVAVSQREKDRRHYRFRPRVEQLESRLAPAVTPVTFSLTHFQELEDPDPFPFQGDGDYYVAVEIHDFAEETSGIITGEDFDTPWSFTKNVDVSLGTIFISFGIRDEDDDPDDHIDINPVDNVTDIVLIVDLFTGRWTGDVNWPTNVTEGDSDFEEDSIEGGEKGKATFSIYVPFADVDSDGDGLPNRWETTGIDANNDGTIDLTLNSDPNHKDLFIEVDAMTGLGPKPLAPITGASFAGPIVITAAGHGLTTGTRITVKDVLGNTAANGTFTVTRVDNDRFQLDGSAANAPYSGGGTWSLADVPVSLATNTTLDLVIDAFLKAPVSNPDGKPGINLHIQIDNTNIAVANWDTDLNAKSGGPYGEDLNANGVLDAGPDGDPGTGDAGDEDINNNDKLDDGDAEDQGGYAFYKPLKQAQFGTADQRNHPTNSANILEAKRVSYRYSVFANYRVDSRGSGKGVKTDSGGRSYSFSDFSLTLGNWTVAGGAPDEQAATFMHELGHSLGLAHGGTELMTGQLSKDNGVITGLSNTAQLRVGGPVSGIALQADTVINSIDSATQITVSKTPTHTMLSLLTFADDINHKPNYHSLMNYTWQLPNTLFPESWYLDFSRDIFPDLNENNGLNEDAGIGGHAGHRTLAGPLPARVVTERGPVDWSRGHKDGDGDIDNDTGVGADITHVDAEDDPSPNELLKGHLDWPNLNYAVGVGALSDGASPDFKPEDELSQTKYLGLNGILRYKMPAGNGADAVTLKRNGDYLEIRDDATRSLLARLRADVALTAEVIGADNENDKVTVDFGGGNPIPSQGLSFGGGAGAVDTLVLAGTLPATPVYTPDATGQPDRGSLALGSSVIKFSGLEFVRPVAPDLTGVQLSATVINENDEVTLTGQFLDPGSLSSHSVTVNWGDGVTDAPVNLTVGARSFSITRRYRDDNPTATPFDINNLVVTVKDNDNLTDTGAASIRVNNLDPVFTAVGSNAPSSDPGQEGVAMTLTGSFSDVGTLDTHRVFVTWGDDGTTEATVTEAGGTGTFTASHAFQFGGIYQILVTLRDDDTGQATKTKTIFVTGVGVHEVGGFTSLQVVGSKNGDNVQINKVGADTIRVHASFLADGKRDIPLAGLDIIQVALLGGDDKATVGSTVNLPAVIDGGEGNDDLNGGGAGSAIVGGNGDDSGNGGGRNDILIGGRGQDRLVANGGDDILIAGYTSYDSGVDDDKIANDLALLKLLSEWTSTRPYSERVANVESGVGPVLSGTGLSLKKGTTVFDDADADALTGSSGDDWFFFDPLTDTLTDRHTGEDLN